MKIEKAIKKFATKWAVNMKEAAPYRTGKLKDSIEVVPNPKQPVIDMLYYGQYQNYGTKYIKDPSRFIDKSLEKTEKQLGEEIMDQVWEEIKLTFDKTLKQ